MRLAGAAVLASLALMACKDDPIRPLLDEDGQLQVRPGLVRMMPGETVTLEAVAFDEYDNPVFTGPVVWSSLDSDIVTVDGGVVTAVAPGWGRVVARASDRPQQDTAHIAVGLDLVDVSVGAEHACGLTTDGAAWCWGGTRAGNLGALGTGAVPTRFTPAAVVGGLDFSLIAAGDDHSCGLAGGSVYCWGDRIAVSVDCTIQINFGCHTPELVLDGSYEHLATSRDQRASCATGDAGLVCWGSAQQAAPGCPLCTPTQHHAGLTGPVTLGRSHGCALDSGGAPYCWGLNLEGQLGVDEIPAEHCSTTLCVSTTEPIPVNTSARFIDVAAGSDFTCGLTSAGQAFCWGAYLNYSADTRPGRTPVAVGGALRFTAIDAGDAHACGLTAEGRLHCWGANAWSGALGEPAEGEGIIAEPRAVAPDMTFSSLSAGDRTTCAVSTDAGVYCTGHGFAVGQGMTLTTATMIPLAPPGPPPAYLPPVN